MRVTALLCCLALAASTWAQTDCADCHGSGGAVSSVMEGQPSSLIVDDALYGRSAHGAFSCDDCHFDYEEYPHLPAASSAACYACHDDFVSELEGSVHGDGAMADGSAVSCSACHGVHDVLPAADPDSTLHPLKVFRACGACHFEDQRLDVATHEELLESPVMDLAHARGLLGSGLTVSATCVSCHGGHDIVPLGSEASRVSRSNVAETCGSCHLGIQQQHARGVHAVVAPGADPAGPRAACSDCHQPHHIGATDTEAFRLSSVQDCGSCHEDQWSTYSETFHGKLTTLGGLRAAKCQDCHSAHEVLPTTDPGSTLSPARKVETCARCHEGAHASFAEYLPHATHDDPDRWPWLYYSFWGMTILLGGTMTGAIFHSLLFFVRLLLDRKHWKGHKKASRAGGQTRLYRRFDRGVRIQHLLMVISFMTLAVTGMLLKFSWTPWAATVTRVLGGVDTTHVLHRVAALLLVGVFIAHVLHALRVKRELKRTWLQVVNAPDSILFNLRDLKEVGQTMKWFVGLGSRPRYGRYTYWEKFDYFAVFWGVFIIGGTGFALWFPVEATRLFPGWMLNVFGIIHSDEALLATAFIFVIHFFNANFRPDKFPMDMAMFTGRMTFEELEYERPREYEHLVKSGRLEEHVVGPMPEYQVRVLRVFASLALLTGVALIVLIAYALAQQALGLNLPDVGRLLAGG